MLKLSIDDLAESRELDLMAMKSTHGGSTTFPTYLVANNGTSRNGPGGPRPPEDQIIWPDNPFDIIDMI